MESTHVLRAPSGRRILVGGAVVALMSFSAVGHADAATKKTTFPIASGTATLTVDESLLGVLSRSGVAVTPIAPATVSGTFTATPTDPAGTAPVAEPQSVVIPVKAGKIDLKKKALTISQKGGLSLGGSGLAVKVDLANVTVSGSGTKGVLKADALANGQTVSSQSGLLDLTKVALPKTMRRGQTITIRGVEAMFRPSIVTTLQTFVTTLPGAPLRFGSLSLKLKLR